MSAVSTLENADSREFWEGARQGRLLFQKCRACSAVQFPPRHQCAACWEDQLEWAESRGHGVIESMTVVRRAPTAAFRAKVPYVVAAVAVEEGPRMITNLVGEGAASAKIGDAVVVQFVADDADHVLPQFRLAGT